MDSVRIREHPDMARGRAADASMIVKGAILVKQEITTVEETAIDCAAFSGKTHFVALEAVDSDIRYRMRPKAHRWTPLAAAADDTPLPAGGVAIEAVYPGAIMSFLQTSQLGGGEVPFQQSYIPILLL